MDSNKKKRILNIIMVLLIGVIILSGTMISIGLKDSKKQTGSTITISDSAPAKKENSKAVEVTPNESIEENEQPQEKVAEANISESVPKDSDTKVVEEENTSQTEATTKNEEKEEAVEVPKEQTESNVSIVINCAAILNNMDKLTPGKEGIVPSNGILLSSEMNIEEGENVFSVLKRACNSADVQLEYSYTPVYGSYYIEGIGNLYEYDCGDQSGWMYRVNGGFPGVGVDSYTLKDKDSIEFVYTCNGYGEDVGG